MSNKLTNGFCVKLSVVAIAASLSITALPRAQAETASKPESAASTASATKAPTPGDNSAAASSATTSSGSSTSSSSSTPSDIPPGVLWTDPKYAVKEMPAAPARVAVPSAKHGTTGTTTPDVLSPAASVPAGGYDEKEAKDFATTAGMPQYLWTKQDATKGKKTDALNATAEMAAYNRMMVEKFVANMTVPTSATLVENSKSNYLYLISFTIDEKGKLTHIQSEKSWASINAVNLADDNENALMTNSITTALSKCSPVKVPPVGIAPWYMLLKYEPNTGKVFVANLNAL